MRKRNYTPESTKKYRDENKEAIKLSAKRYRETHKEKIKECSMRPRSRWNYLKRRARLIGKGFDITFEQYEALIIIPCVYCSNRLGSPSIYGIGLDRIDNDRGYYFDNVQSCCGVCNTLRNEHLTVAETHVAVGAVLRYRALQEGIVEVPNSIFNNWIMGRFEKVI